MKIWSYRIAASLVALTAGGCPYIKEAKQCEADIAAMQRMEGRRPEHDYSGRWSCIFQSLDGGNGTESLEITQSGSRLMVSSRDGFGGAAVLEGTVSGHTLEMAPGDRSIVIRVDGDSRALDGVIRTHASEDCRARRYTCNRRR